MSWVYEIIEELKEIKEDNFTVESGWSPSGFFHIGNARAEFLTPYAVKKALEEEGFKVRHVFVVDDFDAFDKVPKGISKDFERYLGIPYYFVPSPKEGYKSWKEYFLKDLKDALGEYGAEDIIFISNYEEYKKGKYNKMIQFFLEKENEVNEIWNSITGSKEKRRLVQVKCPVCNNMLTTIDEIYPEEMKAKIKCKCGFEGEVSLKDGNAKLLWRVDWVARWILNDVDFESGGKDHFAKGGSVDTGKAFLKAFFPEKKIVLKGTGLFLYGKEKMSGSKGTGISLKEWNSFAFPELLWFISFFYDPSTDLDLNYRGKNFFNYTRLYERAERVYFGKEEVKNKGVEITLRRAYELSKRKNYFKYQVPYETTSLFLQLYNFNELLVMNALEKAGFVFENLTEEEKKEMLKEIKKVGYWLKEYADESVKIKINKKIDFSLFESAEREAFLEIAEFLKKAETPDEIQTKIFNVIKEKGLKPRIFFKKAYNAILNSDAGPKLGTLLFALGYEGLRRMLDDEGH